NTPTIAAPVVVWAPKDWVTVAGGLLDANSQANTLAAHAFASYNVYGVAILSYMLGHLPGQFSPQAKWKNKSKIDFGDPFGPLLPSQIPQAVAVLLGSPRTEGLPINYRGESWGTIGNFSQYLVVLEEEDAIAQKLHSGQPLRGVGVVGRYGYAPA